MPTIFRAMIPYPQLFPMVTLTIVIEVTLYTNMAAFISGVTVPLYCFESYYVPTVDEADILYYNK